MLVQVLSGLFDISWFYFGIEHFKLTVLRSTVIKILNDVKVLGVFNVDGIEIKQSEGENIDSILVSVTEEEAKQIGIEKASKRIEEQLPDTEKVLQKYTSLL